MATDEKWKMVKMHLDTPTDGAQGAKDVGSRGYDVVGCHTRMYGKVY